MKCAPSCKRSLLTLAVCAATSVYAEQAEVPNRDIADIEKIVIIGEKANRSLKDSTTSISVLTEEALNNTQYKSVSDALSEIANVVVPSGGLPDIRGVSGNGSAGGFNSISGGAKGRVTTLIDGVAQPFVADLGGDTGIWDLEQIEVYRGPQSTSNGRNSIAGSVFIKTKDPSQDWEGAARLGYRNQDSYIDTSGVISGPIVDEVLAFRLSVQHLNADTITNDTGFESNPADYDIDEIKTTRIRGKLLWAASEDLSFMLTHTYNNEVGDTGRIYYEYENLEEHNRIFFRDIETDSSTTTLTAEYRVSNALSFDVLLSAMDYEWGFDSYESTDEAEQQLMFDESNLTFDAKANFVLSEGNVSGFFGVYYFNREQDILSEGTYSYFGDDESTSLAVYGETNFVVADDVNIIAGARFERESQDRHFVFGPIDSNLDQDTNIFLPKLVLQYAWTQDTTLSLSARKGYNAAGGALNFAAGEYYFFDEESVYTYELSSRTQLEHGFLNANVFYNDYEGFQALNTSRSIVNMPEVITFGAELEYNTLVAEDVELNVGVGVLHSNIQDAGVDYADVDGNELNSAPSFNASLAARYWLDDQFNLGASVRYVGEYFGDFTNTSERIAGDYTLVRLNANYTTDNWLLTAYIDNVFDETAIITKEPVGAFYTAGYAAIADPRNIGVSATYRF